MQRSCSFPTSHPLRHESDTLSLYLYGNTENEATSIGSNNTNVYIPWKVCSFISNQFENFLLNSKILTEWIYIHTNKHRN